ncbi:MAG TPA: FtsQ-type POTRA domain-containing protein [Prolixibacteraceae bacterium]|nr:FtsQ-type POTRA domain-containing protein [Prolixibacteraceae bacterium]
MKRRIIFMLFGLIFLVALIVVSAVFISKQREKATCTGVDVFFDEDEQFIPSKDIEYIVYNSVKNLKSRKLKTLNTEKIEANIEKLPWVKKAEVFIGYQKIDSKFFAGRLKVFIDQREPYFRVMHGEGGYYVDREGNKMPFSPINTAKVVVCSGWVTNEMIHGKLMEFINYINDDKFWKAQIEQIFVKPDGDLVLVPRLGGHLIEIGQVENLDKKFRNLMALYEDGFKDGGWEKYRKVSVKYNNLVVCTRK